MIEHLKCPPCNGRCRQGRDCPALPDDAGEPLSNSDRRYVVKVAIGICAAWAAFALCLLAFAMGWMS